MDLNQYLRSINALKSAYNELMCMYCGVETPALGEICMCANCESLAIMSRTALARRESDLVKTLDSINAYIEKSDFPSAIAAYDKLNADKQEPAYLYAEALIYIRYSNYEISQISYDKSGFMDENTLHRNNASKFESAAKKLLAKAIYNARSEIAANNASLNTVYALFLSQRKLGNMRGAKDSISMLTKLGKQYVTEYATMTYETEMMNYDSAIKHAEMLISSDNFSINAFFYIAFALFKKGKNEDAKKLLEAIKPSIASKNVDRLIEDIKSADSI